MCYKPSYNKYIDLRSDTVTQPTKAMRKSICKAIVGDELYYDDPSTKELELFCAEYFGKESSLFIPSGMMANLIAIRCYTTAGNEILVDKNYHIFYYERSAVTDLTRASLVSLHDSPGIIRSDQLMQYFSVSKCHATEPKIPLLWLENTISGLAGKVYPLEELKKVYNTAKKIGLSVHLDGARLLNACIATGISPSEYCKYTDSLTITFTKGIGAPFGAMLIGSNQFIYEANIYKKRFGGGMHQSGMMAAACKYALENNVRKIHLDHANAKLFTDLLNKNTGLDITTPETNIVIIDISSFGMDAKSFVEKTKSKGLLLYLWNNKCVRAVFHYGINNHMLLKAVQIIQEIKRL